MYQGKKGSIAEQPSHVHEALQWLEAILERPPTRIEKSGERYTHILLPDGFWDPVKQYGGIGAVLLRQHSQNLTYGCSVPDHLAAQLLTATESKLTKAQRNTQCELLAMLAAILTWREELQGATLLILSDSTASLGNLHSGTSADDHSQQIIGQILYLMVIYKIQYWEDWVPGKQNPGDPYSRPLTNAKDAKKLDELLKAKRCAPQLPTSLRAGPTAWREFLKQKKKPSEWNNSIKFQVMAGLGVIQPQEVAEMLVETFRDHKQPFVTTGYWPKRDRTETWYPHMNAVIQNLCDAIAPTEGISCIKVELGTSNSSKTPAKVVMAIRITGTRVFIGRWNGNGYNTILKADFNSKGMQMTLHAGRASETIPASNRPKLLIAGFSLRNIP